jgi:threonine/homoserine efflux transporter RhtA
MLSVQLGSALSVGLIDEVGAAGTAWLRLTAGAIIFVVIARPPLRSIRRSDLPALLGLGVATGLMTILFLAAIERIGLGAAVSIEFLGPLTVAAIRSRNARALTWPGLALLLPVLPFALEMLALRRMTPSAFGTLMAVEPAIAVILGLIVLHQTPTLGQIFGIIIVVVAGVAAQRVGRALDSPSPRGDGMPESRP